MNAVADEQRPTMIEIVGSAEFFAMMRKQRAGELRVNTVVSTGNASWRFYVSYPVMVPRVAEYQA